MANQRSLGTLKAALRAIRQLGVARIADDEDAHVAGGVLGNGLALADEDFAVLGQEVFAFHARLAREGADENGPVDIFKTFVPCWRWEAAL